MILYVVSLCSTVSEVVESAEDGGDSAPTEEAADQPTLHRTLCCSCCRRPLRIADRRREDPSAAADRPADRRRRLRAARSPQLDTRQLTAPSTSTHSSAGPSTETTSIQGLIASLQAKIQS